MTKRVLVVASAGGHWQQLMMIRESFDHHNVLYMTTKDGIAQQSGASPFVIVPDCNRNQPIAVAHSFFSITKVILRYKPQIIITTGAMPGFLALVIGYLLRSKTIWIDSFANPEVMTMSGKYSKKIATLCLVQWEDLAKREGVEYAGRVI